MAEAGSFADRVKQQADIVRVVAGDAFKEVPKVEGTFDLVFLDAWKPDYKKFFDMVFPRVNPGGLFLAHNVINKKNDMQDFLSAIQMNPQAFTTTARIWGVDNNALGTNSNRIVVFRK